MIILQLSEDNWCPKTHFTSSE